MKGVKRMYEPKVPMAIRISQIRLLQGRIFESILKSHSNITLNAAQIHILFYLWKEDGISISELSKRTELAKTTLTSMLDRLEQSGWVKRESNPNNRREIKVVLSDTAFEAEEECNEMFQKMMEINFSGFEEQEKEELNQYLARIYQNLLDYEDKKK